MKEKKQPQKRKKKDKEAAMPQVRAACTLRGEPPTCQPGFWFLQEPV